MSPARVCPYLLNTATASASVTATPSARQARTNPAPVDRVDVRGRSTVNVRGHRDAELGERAEQIIRVALV
jgi:hypothetical protein